MSLTGPGRKAAVLCTAVVLLGSLAVPAQAAPLRHPPASRRRRHGSGVAGGPVPRGHRRGQVQ